MFKRGVATLLFVCAAVSALAQIPAGVLVLKLTGAEQTSANTLTPQGAALFAQATFPELPLTVTDITLTGPNGIAHKFERQPGGTFQIEEDFADDAALDAAFPDGTYTIATVGTPKWSKQFPLASGNAVAPVRITDFNALQNSPTSTPTLTWEPIAGAAANDFLELVIGPADGGKDIVTLDLAGTDTSGKAWTLPSSTPLQGTLMYARLTTAVSDDETEIDTGRGFILAFPVSAAVAPPQIWVQPAGGAIPSNQSYSMSVKATGDGNLSYQWYKNGAAIQFAIYPNYGGDNLAPGTYTVKVTNTGGTVVSDPAVITIVPPPLSIMIQPVSKMADQFRPLTLSASVPSNLGNVTYQWLKDGVAVPGASGTGTSAFLNFPTPQRSDAGSYVAQFTAGNAAVSTQPAVVGYGPRYTDTTIAGVAGQASVVDGPAGTAHFGAIYGLARDNAGNFYVADAFGSTIRKITSDGTVSTLAGSTGKQGSVDGTGGDARFTVPIGLGIDANGNLYTGDNATVRKITPNGVVTTIAGAPGVIAEVDGPGAHARFTPIKAVAVDPASGVVYVAESSSLRRIAADGSVSTIPTGPTSTWASVTVDPFGNVYVAGAGIAKVTPQGDVTHYSVRSFGTQDGIGANASAQLITAIAVDATGNIYIADPAGGIRRLSPDGVLVSVGSGNGYMNTLLLAPDGAFYFDSGVFTNTLEKAVLVDAGSAGLSFVAGPTSHTMSPGASVLLTAQPSGPVQFASWRKDGVPIFGATDAQLYLTNIQPSDAGQYTYMVGNSAGTAVSSSATVSVSTTAVPGRLLNLSIRSALGTDADTLIVGFAVDGAGDTKPLLMRGLGPVLNSFAVAHAHPDPQVAVFHGSTEIGGNDNWTASLAPVFNSVQALPLQIGSADAAVTANLPPGTYSVQIGAKNMPGIGMAEIYDLDLSANPSTRLVNVSTRGRVGAGDAALIAGFVIGGDTDRTVLIRGVGSTLGNFGVSDVLPDAAVILRRGQTIVATSHSWYDEAPWISKYFSRVNAFGINNDDAALMLTLPPGVYTVQLSGDRNSTGVGLIEVYDLQ